MSLGLSELSPGWPLNTGARCRSAPLAAVSWAGQGMPTGREAATSKGLFCLNFPGMWIPSSGSLSASSLSSSLGLRAAGDLAASTSMGTVWLAALDWLPVTPSRVNMSSSATLSWPGPRPSAPWPRWPRWPGHGAASSLLVGAITGCLPGAGRETELGRVDWMWRMFDKSSSAFCLKVSVVSSLKIKNVNVWCYLRWSRASRIWSGHWRPTPESMILLRPVNLPSVNLSCSVRNLLKRTQFTLVIFHNFSYLMKFLCVEFSIVYTPDKICWIKTTVPSSSDSQLDFNSWSKWRVARPQTTSFE